MWYTNSYRRHLCDMHIEDWNDEFLSEFDIDEYFKNIKAAHIQSAMIYLQSHVGYCYYPTKVGKVHKAFVGREYDMKKIVKKIKDSGMDTIGYYSLIYNTWAHDKFPSWKMINKDVHSRRDMYVKHSGEADTVPEDTVCVARIIWSIGSLCLNKLMRWQAMLSLMRCFMICFSGRIFAIARHVWNVGRMR